jgi:hypothetical protein
MSADQVDMLRKIIFAIGLACFSLGAAATAEPEVSFSSPVQLGQLKLDAGLYKVKLIGTVAMFTSSANGKTYSTITKTERSQQKASFTAVLGATADGVQKVETIVIAGSEYRLVFTK